MLPPAEAGAHLSAARAAGRWVPAFPTELVRGLKAHGQRVACSFIQGGSAAPAGLQLAMANPNWSEN